MSNFELPAEPVEPDRLMQFGHKGSDGAASTWHYFTDGSVLCERCDVYRIWTAGEESELKAKRYV